MASLAQPNLREVLSLTREALRLADYIAITYDVLLAVLYLSVFQGRRATQTVSLTAINLASFWSPYSDAEILQVLVDLSRVGILKMKQPSEGRYILTPKISDWSAL
jgi:hypothetical protein